MNDEEKFKEELTALTKKYGIVIWGCGCCGSPSLMDLEDGMEADSICDLRWLEDHYE